MTKKCKTDDDLGMHVCMYNSCMSYYRSALDKLDPLDVHGVAAISKHPSPINAFMVRTLVTLNAVYESSTASISAQLHFLMCGYTIFAGICSS
jgi:hypothetical protein